jgi:arabinose-5-phosphate isomerase
MREVVVTLAEKRGIAIARAGDRVAGVFTSGDLTRLMERTPDFMSIPLGEVMNRAPQVARAGELGSAAVFRMEQRGIMAMPVVDDAGALAGVVHLHDLMRAGAA